MNKNTSSGTDLDLDKLEALANGATQGAWSADVRDEGCAYLNGLSTSYSEWYFTNAKDAAFIAAANPATVLQLIGLARRASTQPAGAPAQAQPDLQRFTAWLEREIPAGTVISDPAWWAPRILRAALSASPSAPAVQAGVRPVATVIKKGAERTWMSENLGSLPDGMYSLYTGAAPAEQVTQQPSRDWTEDFAHENGNYQNRCSLCASLFFGHKRRVVCKACDQSAAPLEAHAGAVPIAPEFLESAALCIENRDAGLPGDRREMVAKLRELAQRSRAASQQAPAPTPSATQTTDKEQQ